MKFISSFEIGKSSTAIYITYIAFGISINFTKDNDEGYPYRLFCRIILPFIVITIHRDAEN